MIRGRVLPREDAPPASERPTVRKLPVEPRTNRAVPREWMEKKAEADALVTEARQEAAAIFQRAREEASRALEIERKELEERESARLSKAFLELHAREERLRDGELARALEIGTMLAERITQKSLTLDPQLIRGMAENIAKEARGARSFRFEVHPEDEHAIRSVAWLAELPGGSYAIDANPELARGDVLLHTDLGTIDGRIRTQIERLRRALEE